MYLLLGYVHYDVCSVPALSKSQVFPAVPKVIPPCPHVHLPNGRSSVHLVKFMGARAHMHVPCSHILVNWNLTIRGDFDLEIFLKFFLTRGSPTPKPKISLLNLARPFRTLRSGLLSPWVRQITVTDLPITLF